MSPPAPRGRGAASNPPNRFEPLAVIPDGVAADPDDPAPRTRLLRDASRSIIATNSSPDLAYDATLNPYRGCEHGCIYCYARPYHEYLGFSAGLDFETTILVKPDAPALLRRTLASPRWRPRPIGLSGVTDPYQPAERRLRLTRRCLEVLAEFRNPVGVVTKNHLVTRDIDLLAELASFQATAVHLSITTLRPELQRVLEPRTSTPAKRLQAIETLARAGIPVAVIVAPLIPGLTDEELPAILKSAADAGARSAGYLLLRLPHGVKDLFLDWLDRHMPDRKPRILSRLREVRRGRLHCSDFATRGRGEGEYARQIARLFEATCRRSGLAPDRPALSAAAFRRPARVLERAGEAGGQGELFGGG